MFGLVPDLGAYHDPLDFAADQRHDATVLGAACRCFITGHRLAGAITLGCNAQGVNAKILHHHIFYGVGARATI